MMSYLIKVKHQNYKFKVIGIMYKISKTKVMKIKNCRECPFANYDNEYGFDSCNLSEKLNREIVLDKWEELPRNNKHKNCPIKDSITLTVEK